MVDSFSDCSEKNKMTFNHPEKHFIEGRAFEKTKRLQL